METIFSPNTFTKVEIEYSKLQEDKVVEFRFYKKNDQSEYTLNDKISFRLLSEQPPVFKFTGDRSAVLDVDDIKYHFNKSRKNNWILNAIVVS